MRKLFAFIAFAVLILGSNVTAFTEDPAPTPTYTRPILNEIMGSQAPLVEIQMRIQAEYYRERDPGKFIEDTLKGGLPKSLDPNSRYVSLEDLAEEKSDMSGKFIGIGVEITKEGENIVVISPIEDTPAWQAGIQAGDIITHVGESADQLAEFKRGIDLLDVVKLLRGPEGSTVFLKILRNGKPHTFSIVRSVIQTTSVEGKLLSSDIAYVRVKKFDENAFVNFRDVLINFRKSGVRGAVLDFRNNPGGLLVTATSMAQLWSKKTGDILITEKYRKGDKSLVVTEPLGELKDFPVVILVNKGSASASEVFAGTMQDWGHPVVGVLSYGKGTIQKGMYLSTGGMLFLTIAEYLVGNAKKPVHGIGITPDYVVENEEVKLPKDPVKRMEMLRGANPAHDRQLAKAIEVLKGLLEESGFDNMPETSD